MSLKEITKNDFKQKALGLTFEETPKFKGLEEDRKLAKKTLKGMISVERG